MGSEELEGALGAQGLSGFLAQNRRPSQIIGRSLDSFFVGDTRLVLQEQCEGQQGGWHTGPSDFIVVEVGKVLVCEEPGSGVGQLGMESARREFEIKDIADFKQRYLGAACSDHASDLLRGCRSAG